MKSTRRFYKIRMTAVVLMLTTILWRSESLAQQKPENLLKATANFQANEAIAPDATIEISLNRALQSSEKIAVTIEQMDVSGLFSRTEKSLRL